VTTFVKKKKVQLAATLSLSSRLSGKIFTHAQKNRDFILDTDWSHRRGCLWDWYLDKGPVECPSGAVTYKSGPVVELSVKIASRGRNFQIFPLKIAMGFVQLHTVTRRSIVCDSNHSMSCKGMNKTGKVRIT